jgi:YggT family protein
MMVLMRVLGAVTSLYMILVFVRVMLTWFDGASLGKPAEVLANITDPYLDWFRRFPALQAGGIDFSAVAALSVLALANNIVQTIAVYGRITVGIILSLILNGVWSALAFILVFFAVILGVRLFFYTLGRNSVLPIWRTIDALCKPVLYRINRFVYRDRLVNYQTGIITAIAVLIGARIVGGIAVGLLAGMFVRLPF